MSKIIIGIHGLGNKPNEKQLELWWKAAILEGLGNLDGRGLSFVKFKLIYWASVLHPQPYNHLLTDEKNPLFLDEPYAIGSAGNFPKNWRDEKISIRDRLNEQIDRIFLEDDGTLNFSKLTDFILRHFIKDLDAYYNDNDGQTREKICRKLAESLIKNRRKKILLIAHSMGSIIAWDVLKKWVPHIKIHTLVTMGSPLGNPIVRSRMLSELSGNDNETRLLKTPENIYGNWFNLADYKDRVAMSYDIKNDFLPNSRGIQPQDHLIWNNYEYKGERNPHKSYGYLRSPEAAKIIRDFSKSIFFI